MPNDKKGQKKEKPLGGLLKDIKKTNRKLKKATRKANKAKK